MNISTKIRKSIAGLVLAVIAATGLSVATASPASAADQIKFCFDWYNGADYATQPVYLAKYSFAKRKWEFVRNGKTDSNGCGVFYRLEQDGYYTVLAYATFGDAVVGTTMYAGWAPTYASPGTGRYDAGQGTVYYYGRI